LSPIQLWNTDLDQFLAEWERTCKEWDDSAIKDSTGKAVKRKQTTLKTRKSLSGPGKKRKDVSDNEGSDDDFMPTKAVAKSAPKRAAEPAERKASGSKRVNAKPAKLESDDEEDFVVKKPQAKAPLKKPSNVDSEDDTKRKASGSKTDVMTIDLDDDDDFVLLKAKEGSTSTKRSSLDSDEDDVARPTTKKPIKKIESDYDEIPKAAPKKKVPTKNDAESDVEMAAPVAKGKGKGKAAPKRKSPSSDDDADDDLYTKPAVKKRKPQQISVTNKEPPSPSKVALMKPRAQPKKAPPKKNVDSDEDEPEPIVVTKRTEAPKRAARAAPKKYIEIGSEDEDAGKDETFEISD